MNMGEMKPITNTQFTTNNIQNTMQLHYSTSNLSFLKSSPANKKLSIQRLQNSNPNPNPHSTWSNQYFVFWGFQSSYCMTAADTGTGHLWGLGEFEIRMVK